MTPRSSADFDAYYDLRWRLLRRPWGQRRGSERDPLDDELATVHLMAQSDAGTVVAAARLHLNTPAEAQVRYMAVAPAWRRRGLGSALLAALEEQARQAGAAVMVIDAREQAAGFYGRCGYCTVGPAPTRFGRIRHVRMRRDLAPGGAAPVHAGQAPSP